MRKQDYEMEWMRLRYQEGMGTAKFWPPPDRNFVRAYHLTSAKYGESNIKQRRLKVTEFSDANDPFELMALNFHKPTTLQLVKDFKNSRNISIGLLCFSKNWTNPLLWSHYAEKHKGVCLGFDLKRGNELQEVSYVEKRLRMQDDDPQSIPQDLQELLLRTKYEGWEYEQELRRFVELSEAKQEQVKGKEIYFWPFDKDLVLKEVILGEQSDLSLRKIRQLADAMNSGVVVFRARLERRAFRIVGDGRSVRRCDLAI